MAGSSVNLASLSCIYCVSPFANTNELQYAVPGGLIGEYSGGWVTCRAAES